MIKSHLLYQLSYVPKTGPGKGEHKALFPRYGGNFDTYKNKNQAKIIKNAFYFVSVVAVVSDICCARFIAATLSDSIQSKIRPIIDSVYFADRCRFRRNLFSFIRWVISRTSPDRICSCSAFSTEF